jgi:hypothetical protein
VAYSRYYPSTWLEKLNDIKAYEDNLYPGRDWEWLPNKIPWRYGCIELVADLEQ